MADETYADLVREAPGAAALIADIQEANRRDIVASLPTWADLDAAKQESYWAGYEAGRLAEQERLHGRIFGDDD